MSHTAHIFVGKELSVFCDEVSCVIAKQHADDILYNHLFHLTSESKDQFNFRKIVYPTTQDTNLSSDNSESINANQLASYWSNSVFDRILTIDANQDVLNVFIHFSFLRTKSYEVISSLCSAIKNAQRPTAINFIAYGSDLSKFIETNAEAESGKNVFLTPSQARAKVEGMYADYKLAPQKNNFILLQNRTTNGFAILSDEDGSQPFYDMIGNLLPLLSAHYHSVMSHATGTDPHELLGLGFSSLYFDKYLFVNYLLQKVFLQSIDNQSVNVENVDINLATFQASEILKNKSTILSRFLQKYKDNHISPEYNEICAEVDEIFQRVSEYIGEENGMTTKAAVLAAILSQVECNLFESSFQMLDNQCYEDLYAEAIDFFITNDEVGYYQICGEKPINSIAELKKVNRTLVQTEVQIRTLEKQIETFSSQIEQAERVEECFIDDGYFMFKDKKFRLLPDIDEEPLRESYEPHDVTCESIDLRGQFSSIKDQGQQGSCLSFTLTSIFEYMMKTNLKEDCDLSEAFLYYNARNLDCNDDVDVNTDNGSRFHPSIESLSKYGIALEKYWPYNDQAYSTRPTEQAYEDASTRKLVKALNVERSVNAVKSALVDGFPVAGSFVLYPSFFTNNGYVTLPTQEEIEARKNDVTEEGKIRHSRHAMVIVGYSDKLQMFIVRNSWGTSWGEKGYCYMPYEYIADTNLFEFACILSEVTSLKQPKAAMLSLPALKIDTTDTQIRYYIALASLNKQLVIAKELRERRAILQTYLENQKSIYSDSNERDCFIEANVDSLQKQNEELNQTNKKLQEEVDELHDVIGKKLRVAILDMGVAVLLSAVLLLSAIIQGNHWMLWSILAVLTAVPYMIYVGMMLRKDPATASVKIISAAIVVVVFLPITIWSNHKFNVWWISTLLVSIPFIIYTWIMYYKYYQEWRENRDAKLNAIENNSSTIKKNKLRIDTLRSRAFAAWQTMNSLVTCQSRLTKMYTNFINLINNLRIWYEEIKSMNNDVEIKSRFPNIATQDKVLMDQYFEEELSDTDICSVDLCQDIESHEIAAEYLAKYKERLKKELEKQLSAHLDKSLFNLSEHVATNAFSKLAIPITDSVISEWCRKANVFLHINSAERGIVPTRHYVFAYNMTELQSKLSSKLGKIYPSMEVSSDKYKLTLLSITPLKFEECVMFQNAEKN